MGSRRKKPSSLASPTTAIGIDFGSSKCCVGLVRNGKVEILENERGSKTTPSYVAFTEVERLVGESARDQVALNPTNTVFGAKQLLGGRGETWDTIEGLTKHLPYDVAQENGGVRIKVTYKGKEKKLSPEQIAAMLLSQMRKLAEKHLGRPVREAVIAVPAHFTNAQRRALKDAGTIAGLTVLGLINETTAAAVAYQHGKTFAKKQNVLVVDVGGGAFNAALVEVQDASVEVKAIGGTTELSGGELDRILMEHLADSFTKNNEIDVKENKKAMERVRIAVHKAKHTLSLLPEAVVEVDCLFNDIDLKESISRNHLNGLFLPTARKHFFMIVIQVLSDAKLTLPDVDEVVLIGGTTRVPAVQEALVKLFAGKPFNKTVNPDEAVAYGAALQAAILAGDNSVGEVSVGDIVRCPVEYPHRFQGMEWATKNPIVVPQMGKVNSIYFETCGEVNNRGNENKLHHIVDSFGVYHPMGNQQLIDKFRDCHVDVMKINAYLTIKEIASLSREVKQLEADEVEHRHLISIMSKLEAKCFEVNDKFSLCQSDCEPISATSAKRKALEYANKVQDWLDQGKLSTRKLYEKKTEILNGLIAAAETERTTSSQPIFQKPTDTHEGVANGSTIEPTKSLSLGKKTAKFDTYPMNDDKNKRTVQTPFQSAPEELLATKCEPETGVDRKEPALYTRTLIENGKAGHESSDSSPPIHSTRDHDPIAEKCSSQTSKPIDVTTTSNTSSTGNSGMVIITHVDEPDANDNIMPEVDILAKKLAGLNLNDEETLAAKDKAKQTQQRLSPSEEASPTEDEGLPLQSRSSPSGETSAAENKTLQRQQRLSASRNTSAPEDKTLQRQQRLSASRDTSAAEDKTLQRQQRLSVSRNTSAAEDKTLQRQQRLSASEVYFAAEDKTLQRQKRLSASEETSAAEDKASQREQQLFQLVGIGKWNGETLIQMNHANEECREEDSSTEDTLESLLTTEGSSECVALQCNLDNRAAEQNLFPSSGGGRAASTTAGEEIVSCEWESYQEKPKCQQQSQVVTPQPEQHSAVTPEPKQHSAVTPEPKQHSAVTPKPEQHYAVTPQPEQHSAVTPQSEDHSAVTPQSEQHSAVTPQPEQHSAVTPQPEQHSAVTPQPEQHSAVTPQPKQHSAGRPQPEQHSAVTPEPKQNSAVTPDPEQYSAVIPQPKQHSAVTPQSEQHSAVTPQPEQHYAVTPQPKQHSAVTPEPKQHSAVTPKPEQHSAVTPQPKQHSAVTPQSEQHSAVTPQPEQHSAVTPQPKQHSAVTPQPGQHSAVTPQPKQHSAVTPQSEQHSAVTPQPKQHSAVTPQPEQHSDEVGAQQGRKRHNQPAPRGSRHKRASRPGSSSVHHRRGVTPAPDRGGNSNFRVEGPDARMTTLNSQHLPVWRAVYDQSFAFTARCCYCELDLWAIEECLLMRKEFRQHFNRYPPWCRDHEREIKLSLYGRR